MMQRGHGSLFDENENEKFNICRQIKCAAVADDEDFWNRIFITSAFLNLSWVVRNH